MIINFIAMAKKNLASLMSGLMGEEQPKTDEQPRTADEAQPEQTTARESKERRGPGRPRKGETTEKTNEIRATFIVDPELVKKVKYISLVDGLLLKDVVNAALSEYVDSWESRNGKIRLQKGN